MSLQKHTDEAWGYYSKWNKLDRERQILHGIQKKVEFRNRIEKRLPGARREISKKVQIFIIRYVMVMGALINLGEFFQNTYNIPSHHILHFKYLNPIPWFGS